MDATPLETFFFPDEDHTLACMIRDALLCNEDDCAISACVVSDDMHSDPGLSVTCDGKESLLSAIDKALAVVDSWETLILEDVPME